MNKLLDMIFVGPKEKESSLKKRTPLARYSRICSIYDHCPLLAMDQYTPPLKKKKKFNSSR